jgi:hypothetical protein
MQTRALSRELDLSGWTWILTGPSGSARLTVNPLHWLTSSNCIGGSLAAWSLLHRRECPVVSRNLINIRVLCLRIGPRSILESIVGNYRCYFRPKLGASRQFPQFLTLVILLPHADHCTVSRILGFPFVNRVGSTLVRAVPGLGFRV